MKARLIASLVIALMLVAILALPAMAAESATITASVTVTEYKSITITDEAPTGITFGSLVPDTADNPDLPWRCCPHKGSCCNQAEDGYGKSEGIATYYIEDVATEPGANGTPKPVTQTVKAHNHSQVFASEYVGFGGHCYRSINALAYSEEHSEQIEHPGGGSVAY